MYHNKFIDLPAVFPKNDDIRIVLLRGLVAYLLQGVLFAFPIEAVGEGGLDLLQKLEGALAGPYVGRHEDFWLKYN